MMNDPGSEKVCGQGLAPTHAKRSHITQMHLYKRERDIDIDIDRDRERQACTDIDIQRHRQREREREREREKQREREASCFAALRTPAPRERRCNFTENKDLPGQLFASPDSRQAQMVPGTLPSGLGSGD